MAGCDSHASLCPTCGSVHPITPSPLRACTRPASTDMPLSGHVNERALKRQGLVQLPRANERGNGSAVGSVFKTRRLVGHRRGLLRALPRVPSRNHGDLVVVAMGLGRWMGAPGHVLAVA